MHIICRKLQYMKYLYICILHLWLTEIIIESEWIPTGELYNCTVKVWRLRLQINTNFIIDYLAIIFWTNLIIMSVEDRKYFLNKKLLVNRSVFKCLFFCQSQTPKYFLWYEIKRRKEKSGLHQIHVSNFPCDGTIMNIMSSASCCRRSYL